MEFSDNRVLLDTDIKELIPGFLDFIDREIKMLHSALTENDYETISVVANRMRRFGGSYGFEVIANAGSSIEKAAEKQDAGKAQKTLESLSAYLDSIEIVYDNGNF